MIYSFAQRRVPMLAQRDPNTTIPPVASSHVSKVVNVSGDELLSLLCRPSSEKGDKPSLKAVMTELKVESQHEVVALLPGTRKLTINFSNWSRLRAEGNADEPTLVISFLGKSP